MDKQLYDYSKSNLISCGEMKQFLIELKETDHMFYSILYNYPRQIVKIIYDDDWGDVVTTLTVADFEKQWDIFASKEFRVVIAFRLFYLLTNRENHFVDIDDSQRRWVGEDEYELCLTSQLQLSKWREFLSNILAAICRDAIMDGHPFIIDDKTIEKYGFTDADIIYLKEPIDKMNKEIMSEFIENYDMLKEIVTNVEIDCN